MLYILVNPGQSKPLDVLEINFVINICYYSWTCAERGFFVYGKAGISSKVQSMD